MYNLDLSIKSRATSELQQYFVNKIVLSTPFHACRMQEIQDGTTGRPTRQTTFTTIIKTTLTLKTILACVSIFSFKYHHNIIHNSFTILGNVINFHPPYLFVIPVPDCLNSIKKKSSQAIWNGFANELQTAAYLKVKSKICDRFSSLLFVHVSPEVNTPNLAPIFSILLQYVLLFCLRFVITVSLPSKNSFISFSKKNSNNMLNNSEINFVM